MTKSRLEAFSDGVFAIAITLLVIDLRPPQLQAGERLAQALWQQWPSYVAYLVSFLTIGVIWLNHHWILEQVVQVDGPLLVLNLNVLLWTALLPFPTAVLAEHLGVAAMLTDRTGIPITNSEIDQTPVSRRPRPTLEMPWWVEEKASGGQPRPAGSRDRRGPAGAADPPAGPTAGSPTHRLPGRPGMNRTARIAVGAAAAGAGLLAAYWKLVRPRALRWGATAEEAARPLPGDELVAKADYVATRAITIHAPAQEVWPWLVQIGSGRAGWYAYDRIDNAGMPSATELIPELQQLQVGDLIPMVVGKDIGVWVKELEPYRRMLWWDEKGEYSWEWLLEPIDQRTTRLLHRLRVTRHPWTRKLLYELVAANGDVVMQRKLLRGIKQRAERLAAHRRIPGQGTGRS